MKLYELYCLIVFGERQIKAQKLNAFNNAIGRIQQTYNSTLYALDTWTRQNNVPVVIKSEALRGGYRYTFLAVMTDQQIEQFERERQA